MTASDKIALSSMLVAICALFTSFWQASQERHHQRLSVRPYVKFNFYYTATSAKLSMDNWGMGPAALHWFRASVDGKPQGSWRQLLAAVGVPKETPFKQSIPAQGVLMQPSSLGNSIEILSVDAPEAKDIMIRAIGRITLEACYCSLYEQCWIASSNAAVPQPRGWCEPAPGTTFAWER